MNLFLINRKLRPEFMRSRSLWPKTGVLAQWRSDIQCVFARDPAAQSVLEVLTTYPGVHAIMAHRISSRLWQRGWRYSARLLSFLTRFFTNVDIHPGAVIGERFFIDHGACVVVGETAVIGNDVTLYHGVTLGGTSWNPGRRHPTLGDGVLVGTGAKILGAITLGRDVRVGANSVVVNDVPAASTVVGIPGRIVRRNTQRSAAGVGIDLDHHLIPDPVGKAIACLLERIDALEQKVEQGGTGAALVALLKDCEPDNAWCESDCSIGRHILQNTEVATHGSAGL